MTPKDAGKPQKPVVLPLHTLHGIQCVPLDMFQRETEWKTRVPCKDLLARVADDDDMKVINEGFLPVRRATSLLCRCTKWFRPWYLTWAPQEAPASKTTLHPPPALTLPKVRPAPDENDAADRSS